MSQNKEHSSKSNLCLCGCGEDIPLLTKKGKPRRFKRGHHIRLVKDKLSGSKCHLWKRGYYYNTAGYVVFSRDGKEVYQHVDIWENFHSACMLPWGQVHHINGIKDDNRIENLQGMSMLAHRRLHMMGNQYARKRKFRI